MSDKALDMLRGLVDVADARLVEALGERLTAVKAIAAYKRVHHLAPVDAEREARLHARWAALAAQHDLDAETVKAVMETVLDACRAVVVDVSAPKP